MSCTDCFNGCGTPTPDTCVKYTGESVPLLGIETGDPISKVEEILINKIKEFAEGKGITLSEINLQCDFIRDLLGCDDPTLVNLIQVLINANCTLKELIDDLAAKVDPAYTFNTLCLTGLPTSPTRDDILQAVINKLCSVSTTVDIIYGDYVKATDLDTLIGNYLAGISGSVQNYTKMVPYVAYEYYGPLGNFNGDGAGIAAAGFDKVYLCVGQTVNGFTLPDRRGRVAVGVPSMAAAGAFTPALPASVDYTLPQNAGTNYFLKQLFGQYFHTLTIQEMPSHTHIATVSPNPHRHSMVGSNKTNFDGFNALAAVNPVGSEPGGYTEYTSLSVTNNSAGNGIQHENRQPSVAAYFIMYIP